MKLEYIEPESNFEIRVGTFHYTENGKPVEAEFFIRTCQDDTEKQASDYNEQLCNEWDKLESSGKLAISYVEVIPNPIF